MPEPPDDMLRCPDCERIFEVVWLNDVLGPPEYCPMCGTVMDYVQVAATKEEPDAQ